MNLDANNSDHFQEALQALQSEAAISAVSIDDQKARFWKKNLQSAHNRIRTFTRECELIDTCANTLGKHFGDLTVNDVMRYASLQVTQ